MSQQLPPCPEARLRVRAASTEANILKQGHWGACRVEVSRDKAGRPVAQTSGCKKREYELRRRMGLGA